MRGAILGTVLIAAIWPSAVLAEEAEFEALPPLDLAAVDSDMVQDVFGAWTIASESGDRTCRVELLREPAIGGMQIEVDPDCEAVFPIMAEIAAWRLLEGWAIDLVDVERHTRIRFSTPDERYVAFPETDGIFTIAPAAGD